MRMSCKEFGQFVPLGVCVAERMRCVPWLRVRGSERWRGCKCGAVLVQVCRGVVSLWVQCMMGSMAVRGEFRMLGTLCDRCAGA